MKLWKVAKRDDTKVRFGYDCTYGVVVRASSEGRARTLASTQAGDEGKEVWFDPEVTSCEVLRVDGYEEVILQDFHAG